MKFSTGNQNIDELAKPPKVVALCIKGKANRASSHLARIYDEHVGYYHFCVFAFRGQIPQDAGFQRASAGMPSDLSGKYIGRG